MPFGRLILGMLAIALAAGHAFGQTASRGGSSPAAPDAAVYFINIKNGATLPRTFTIQFGLRNMGLASAGTETGMSGHHHVLIDTGLPPLTEPIPSDFNHLHFGAGQSEAEITLPPGEHTLQLLFADKDHVPHTNPLYSERIRITVLASDVAASVAPTPAGPQATPQVRQRPAPAKREQRRRQRNDDDDWDW